MRTILILDDNNSQLKHMDEILNPFFKVLIQNNSIDAFKTLETIHCDAVVVDVHMPIINGIEFIKTCKDKTLAGPPPIYFVCSSDNSINTRIQGLNLGIKDFIWPSMDKEEILLRIQNHLPSKLTEKSTLNLNYKNIKLNLSSMSAYLDEKPLDLTLIELKILSHLIANQSMIVSRKDLIDFIWPNTVVAEKTLNTHLTNLRSKIIDSGLEIKSIKGEGIMLA